jgi:hypothetical protein
MEEPPARVSERLLLLDKARQKVPETPNGETNINEQCLSTRRRDNYSNFRVWQEQGDESNGREYPLRTQLA